jgi:hypothetical protein
MSSRPAPTRGLTRRENLCKTGVDTPVILCNTACSSPFRAPKIGVRYGG